MVNLQLPKLKDDWFKFDKVNSFLDKTDLTDNQKLVLTPIIVPSKDYETLRNNYIKSTQKLQKLYYVPMISLAQVVYMNNMSFIVYSAYYMYEWQNFLARECKIVLPLNELTPHKYTEKLINQFIRYKIKDIDKAFMDLIKVRKDNKAYVMRVENTILPLTEVRS